MKTATVYRSDYTKRPSLPYPNAATRREMLNKLIDYLLIGAMGVAAVTVVLFFLTLA